MRDDNQFPELTPFDYTISNKIVWVQVDLLSIYGNTSLVELKDKLATLVSLGFKEFTTSHNEGYYGAIDNYYMETSIGVSELLKNRLK